MKGYEQTCPQVEAIGQINFHGDGVFTPNNWYHNICHKNGKPYLEAIILLADIVSWYLPIYERDEVTGKTIGVRKKFKADKLQRNYDSFADHYGMTKDQARNALKHLERDGLIDLELRTVETSVQKLGNVLFIGVYPEKIKDYTFTLSPKEQTPVLTETDRGIDRKAEGSAQKQTALPTEAQTNTDQSTDLSTDQSTKNIRADEFFTIAPSSQNQENSFHAQTENPNTQAPQTPKPLSPALPENIGRAIAISKQADSYRSFEAKFASPVKVNKKAPLGLQEEGYGDWHLGGNRNNWKPILVKAAIIHLRDDCPTMTPSEENAIRYINNLCGKRDWPNFELLADKALKLETAQAIATQVTPPPAETPQQSAPQIDPIAHKRIIEEARRRVAQQAA